MNTDQLEQAEHLAAKLLILKEPIKEKSVYLVVETQEPHRVMALFNEITNACDYMEDLHGCYAIERRVIHYQTTTPENDFIHKHGWI